MRRAARPQGHQRRVGRRARARRSARGAGGRPGRVAIRINPDIDARSHPHISTGLKINKFGVPQPKRASSSPPSAGRPSSQPRGGPRARRLADHDVEPLRSAAALCRGPGGRAPAGGYSPRIRGPRRRPWDFVRRPGRGVRSRLRRGARRRRSADRPSHRHRARPRDRRAGRRARGQRGRSQAAGRQRASSPSSTPA